MSPLYLALATVPAPFTLRSKWWKSRRDPGWLGALYSKCEWQSRLFVAQEKVAPEPNSAATKPAAVVQSAPAAVQPFSLNVPPETVPATAPCSFPVTPARIDIPCLRL